MYIHAIVFASRVYICRTFSKSMDWTVWMKLISNLILCRVFLTMQQSSLMHGIKFSRDPLVGISPP